MITETVTLAIIGLIQAVTIAMIANVSKKQTNAARATIAVRKDVKATRDHVVNDHSGTNMRDELDQRHAASMAAIRDVKEDVQEVKRDVGGIRSDVRILHERDNGLRDSINDIQRGRHS